MLANRTTRWSLGAALLCVLLLALSWFMLISPRRADADSIRGQAAQADLQASQLQVKIAQLKSEFADLPKQRAELATIKAQLPPTADIPAFVRTLQSLAAQTGVSLDALSPGTPAVVSATSAAGTAASGTAGAGSLVSIPVGLTISGDYFEAALFLKNLQTKTQRSYLISSLALTPATAATDSATAATATPTPTPTATGSAGATAVTATPTVTATPESLTNVSVAVNGSLFVLLDGTSTLDQVKKDTKAAAGSTGSGTSATPTAAATTAASVPNTNGNPS
jgi:Tfp pilus assembly protein PilO